jgi:hypothetical protein
VSLLIGSKVSSDKISADDGNSNIIQLPSRDDIIAYLSLPEDQRRWLYHKVRCRGYPSANAAYGLPARLHSLGAALSDGGDIWLTICENAEGYASKVIGLTKDGKIRKSSAAHISRGKAQRVAVKDLDDLATLFTGLSPKHAACYGVPQNETATIVTKKTLLNGSCPPGAIARDRRHLSYRPQAPGIFFGDYDPRKGHPAKDWREIDDILCAIVPGWSKAKRLWRPSSGAFLYYKDTELVGAGGWHFYTIVDDASAIPMVTAFIYQALWKAGHGYVEIGNAGQLLDRSLIDASVSQPERLDFAAEPVLRDGVTRRTPGDVLLPGGVLSVKGITAEKTLAEWRKTSSELKKAREKALPEARRVREIWAAKRAEELTRQGVAGTTGELAKAVKTAVEHHVLTTPFVLVDEDGKNVSVAEILANPAKYHEARFADPLEPDYNNGDRRIAYADLSGKRPYIYSHAHGGATYRLVRMMEVIRVDAGERPRVVDECLAVMAETKEVYEFGEELTLIADDDGSQRPMSKDLLGDYLGRRIRFLAWNGMAKDYVPIDTPERVCASIIAKRGMRGLPGLRGVITTPTLLADGSLLDKPGYDEVSGLYLHGDHFPTIPDNLDDDSLRVVHGLLWKPFEKFPYVDAVSRGVLLSAVLTVPVRRMLPTAPGYCADANMPGTGKTLLMQCLMRLAGAVPEAQPSNFSDEPEVRKRLLSILRSGVPACLIDNIIGEVKSPAFEAVLTSEVYGDRVLGISQNHSYLTNLMWLMSANNMLLGGDSWRRILITRLDAHCDEPESRRFDLDPREHCRQNRKTIVAATLAILRTFIKAEKPRQTANEWGSFKEWDGLIRQCVLWLADKKIAKDVADPVEAGLRAKADAPGRHTLELFINGIENAFRFNHKFRTREIVERCSGGVRPGDDNLHEALERIAQEKGGMSSAILGTWMRSHEGTRSKGRWLTRVKQPENSKASA